VRINIFHDEWSAVWTISSILVSLRAFLGSPDTETAVEGEIAEEVETRREEFERRAVEWTFRYAVGKEQEEEGMSERQADGEHASRLERDEWW
jgi:ubiquitin-protein ligase